MHSSLDVFWSCFHSEKMASTCCLQQKTHSNVMLYYRKFAYTYVCTSVHTHTHVHTHTRTHTSSSSCHTCPYGRRAGHTYTYTCTHTHTPFYPGPESFLFPSWGKPSTVPPSPLPVDFGTDSCCLVPLAA